jgi:hypothetical protein
MLTNVVATAIPANVTLVIVDYVAMKIVTLGIKQIQIRTLGLQVTKIHFMIHLQNKF